MVARPVSPVVVVGGGAAGLSAALGLAEAGVASTVLEASGGRNPIDRGDVVHLSSQRTLARWGVWSSLEPHRFAEFRVNDGEGRDIFAADLSARTGGETFCAVRHEALVGVLLKRAAADPLIEVHRGERVDALLRQGERVCGARTASDEYVSQLTIVASGGRTSLLAGLSGVWSHDYGVTFYNAHVQADLHCNAGMYVLGRQGLLVVVPLGGSRYRIGIQVRRAERIERVSAVRSMAAIYPPLADAAVQVLETNRYPLQARWAHRWGGPGYAVVGDAAHTVHPVGGQGMNLAFGDADALARHFTGFATGREADLDQVVARYSGERRRAVAPVIALTHLVGLIASCHSTIANEIRRRTVELLGRSPALADAIVRMAAR